MEQVYQFFANLFNALVVELEYAKVLMPSLMQGLIVTLKIFILTLVMSLPLGLPFALGSNSKRAIIRIPCRVYIWLFRGTPLMLQLFFFYFFLPIVSGIKLDGFTTAVFTFVLNYAAYFAEIYRGGIESIDRGQYEASQSLGLSRTQTLFGIIIPQMLKRVLPPISNETITLVKDTALVSVIAVGELIRVARGAVNRDVKVTAFVIAAIIYLILTFILTLLSNYLEKRFSRHESQ